MNAVKSNTARNVIIGAGIGSAIGLAAGILLAPKSGKETRKYIERGTKAALNTVKGTVNSVKGKVENIRPANYEFHYKYSDADTTGSCDAVSVEAEGSAFENRIDDPDYKSNLVNTFEDKDKCCDD
jgi:gas vesicle protein